MSYQALYRKWRPQTFADVIGQGHIIRTLRNSITSGRISHAYLFSGPRGTGKTTVARLMAKSLDCETGPTDNPCGECPECVAISQSNSLNVVEIDAASHRGIEEIRELREQVRYAPVGASYKVYIIDEVHMLTPEAFNALLKTLEEPPAHVVFILATTDAHKMPVTILSRCQRLDFKRLSNAELISRLEVVLDGEQLKAEDGVLGMIAKHAEGGMRDALGVLEQCITYSSELTRFNVGEVLGIAPQEEIDGFLEDLIRKQHQNMLQRISSIYEQGKDLVQFTRDVVDYLRNEVVAENSEWEKARILDSITVFAQCIRDMRYASDVRIPLELAILQLTYGSQNENQGDLSELGKLHDKVANLEAKIAKLKTTGLPVKKGKEAGSSPAQSKRPQGKDDPALFSFIMENWEDYMQILRAERLIQCEAFLREGTPVNVKSSTLIISFPRDRGFHKASIEQEKHREPAERMLSKFSKTMLKIECVFQDEVEASQGNVLSESSKVTLEKQDSQTPANKSSETKSEAKDTGSQSNDNQEYDESVAAALRIFGGRVVKKDEQD